jgi:hypothetical protein
MGDDMFGSMMGLGVGLIGLKIIGDAVSDDHHHHHDDEEDNSRRRKKRKSKGVKIKMPKINI